MNATTSAPIFAARSRRQQADRFGDGLLYILTVLASILALVAIAAVLYKVINGAWPAITHFGLGFVGHTTWEPVGEIFGAGAFIYGTLVTSAIALGLAMPIGIGSGLFITLLAPPRLAAVVTPLVELLAAIPSVVLGLWGIIVVGPFLRSTIEPVLHDVLGFIPLFGDPSTTGLGLFTASVILTIMVVPIIASVSRELFSNVPSELQDAALALGATRWEMVRGVVLSSTRAGIGAASILGLSRALGEAIAVTQVIGGGAQSAIHASLFAPADTLASRIASQFPGADPGIPLASIFYLGVVLLVIELVANIIAQLIVGGYEREHGGQG